MALVDIQMPASQEGTEAVVLDWLKKPGDPVGLHEPVLEISTDKVTMEVAAPAAGVLQEILIPANGTVHPGDILGRIAPGAAAEAPATDALAPATSQAKQPPIPTADRSQRLSPLVKNMLRTHNLTPAQIAGTGRGGRITHHDVRAFLARPQKVQAPLQAQEGSRLIPHTPMRRKIADHMVASMLHTAPHVTAIFDVDLSAVMAHRARHKAAFGAKGVKLTYTAYFIEAATQALHTVPEVNSRWHDEALEVFEHHHIGVATALGKEGLIVPVIHHAQHLGLYGIATQLQDLTERARNGALRTDDVQGGTFTITNHGTGGSLVAMPIINQPQSAILGIGKVEKRVVVIDDGGHDSLQVRPRAYVTLTIDHRALDGFTANAFLSRFTEVLEQYT